MQRVEAVFIKNGYTVSSVNHASSNPPCQCCTVVVFGNAGNWLK